MTCFVYFLSADIFMNTLSMITPRDYFTPRVLSPFRGGGIAYLNDAVSYADWSFHTPGRASQVRTVEGQRSDKVAAQLLFLLLCYFSPLYFPIILLF